MANIQKSTHSSSTTMVRPWSKWKHKLKNAGDEEVAALMKKNNNTRVIIIKKEASSLKFKVQSHDVTKTFYLRSYIFYPIINNCDVWRTNSSWNLHQLQWGVAAHCVHRKEHGTGPLLNINNNRCIVAFSNRNQQFIIKFNSGS